jgi:hypothetical protein
LAGASPSVSEFFVKIWKITTTIFKTLEDKHGNSEQVIFAILITDFKEQKKVETRWDFLRQTRNNLHRRLFVTVTRFVKKVVVIKSRGRQN